MVQDGRGHKHLRQWGREERRRTRKTRWQCCKGSDIRTTQAWCNFMPVTPHHATLYCMNCLREEWSGRNRWNTRLLFSRPQNKILKQPSEEDLWWQLQGLEALIELEREGIFLISSLPLSSKYWGKYFVLQFLQWKSDCNRYFITTFKYEQSTTNTSNFWETLTLANHTPYWRLPFCTIKFHLLWL